MTLTRSIAQAAPVALALAVLAAAMQQRGDQLSAALSLCWIVLGITHHALTRPGPGGPSRVWPFAVVLLLLLNLRGVVLKEGPQPVSHMDYVLLVASVLAGQGQNRAFWRASLATLCLAIASCGLLQAGAVWHHLFQNELGFRFGALLINQTALLTGLGCVCGLSALQLWHEPWPGAGASSRPAHTPAHTGIQLCLSLASLGCAAMTVATHSRAGIGLVPLSLLVAWFFQQGTRHWAAIRHWLSTHMIQLVLAMSLVVCTPWLWLASPQGPAFQHTLANLYGSENRVSDQGRLDVWRCYASLPFRGSNRFLYGVGYGRARELCPIRLPNRTKPLSHAHNLLLQIWAETGALPMIALLAGGVQLSRKAIQQQGTPHAMALSAPLIYGLLFNCFELGMLKVPLLTALFGYLISGLLIGDGFNAAAGDAGLAAAGDNEAAKPAAPSTREFLR